MTILKKKTLHIMILERTNLKNETSEQYNCEKGTN